MLPLDERSRKLLTRAPVPREAITTDRTLREKTPVVFGSVFEARYETNVMRRPRPFVHYNENVVSLSLATANIG